jgi:uncharacterized membrane protein
MEHRGVGALRRCDAHDISADTLQIHPDCFDRCLRTPDRLRVIRDWVKLGGGLIMVGGYLSFSGLEGKGHYQATPLADALPVEMLGYDDRIETPEGVTLIAGETHAILNGLPPDWPHFLGYNRLKAKSDAQVLMSIEKRPISHCRKLRAGAYGRVCIGLLCALGQSGIPCLEALWKVLGPIGRLARGFKHSREIGESAIASLIAYRC